MTAALEELHQCIVDEHILLLWGVVGGGASGVAGDRGGARGRDWAVGGAKECVLTFLICMYTDKTCIRAFARHVRPCTYVACLKHCVACNSQ